MKTTSQIFDFKRYADCLKREMILNGRSWLIRAALMVAIITLMLVFITYPDWDSLHKGESFYAAKQLKGGFNVLKVVMFIFTGIGASLFMENMASAGQRLNELMSPASTLEKYLSRWTICVFGVAIGFLACFSVAELLRVLIITWMWDDVPGLSYNGPFELLKQAEKWYFPWVIMAGIQATFVLGSTVWPKRAFAKTFGFIFALQLFLGLTANITFNAVMPESYDVIGVNDTMNEDDLFLFFSVTTLVWTVYCYIVSYFRMRESEIINRL